jgi:hypothetical protein
MGNRNAIAGEEDPSGANWLQCGKLLTTEKKTRAAGG